MPYANLGKRFLAFLLDIVVWFVLASIIYALLSLLFPVLFTGGVTNDSSQVATEVASTSQAVSEELTGLVLLITGWLYYSITHSSSRQATLGKRAFGLTVTDLSGQKISFGRATGRYFSYIFFTSLFLSDFLPVPFTEKSQALHDLITGTLVLEKRRPSGSNDETIEQTISQ
jgi:uncharacterized RDD family membrane protein YckC